MSFYKKPERDWNDPPMDKKFSIRGIFNKKWILISLAILYSLFVVIATKSMRSESSNILAVFIVATALGILLSPLFEHLLTEIFIQNRGK